MIIRLLPARFASLLSWCRQLTPAQGQQTSNSLTAADLLAVADIAPLLILCMCALTASIILAQRRRHQPRCGVSFAHSDFTTNNLVCWFASDHSRSCKLRAAFWTLEVACCCIFHNALNKALHQGAFTSLYSVNWHSEDIQL